MPKEQPRIVRGWRQSTCILALLLALSRAFFLPSAHFRGRQLLWSQNSSTAVLTNSPLTFSDVTPLPRSRSTITAAGARVACWPSTGGIWIKHVTPAELEFLMLSRSHDVPRPWPPVKAYTWVPVYFIPGDDHAVHPSAIEEDLFCESLRTLGAQFWELTDDASKLLLPIEEAIAPSIRGHLGFAWSPDSGAAAMVNLTEAQQRHGSYLKGYNNVTEVQERYPIVEALGGIRCARQGKRCREMWCQQYPRFCHESEWLLERSDATNRWNDFLNHRSPLEGEELASYGSDEWIRDERTWNFFWKYGSATA